MKHIPHGLLFLCLFLSLALGALAQPVSEAQARERAAAFLSRIARGGRSAQSQTISAAALQRVLPRAARAAGAASLYAYNVGEGGGFILVSADERMYPVLGYALSGAFSFEQLPTQLQALLHKFERDFQRLPASAPRGATPYASAPASAAVAPVAPLLGDITWNQDAPFNALCPSDRGTGQLTPAGCVATATAQIMRYYQYPLHGTGQRSYTSETQRIPLSADFAAATYDWEHMLPSYNEGYTQREGEAVAELLFHVGVACKMDYDIEGSGANDVETAKLLTRYFAYDPNIEYLDHNFYTTAQWEGLVRAELAARRPVLYLGTGPSGGHAFVLDGCDAEGLFHVNWGWGGLSDGYFRTCALEPTDLGIGSGAGAYNYEQAMLTGIRPPADGATHLAQLHLSKPLTPAAYTTARDAETAVTASFYNYGLRNFTGEVALALYDAQGELVTLLATRQVVNLAEMGKGGTPGTRLAYTLPNDLPIGHYTLRLVQREQGAQTYTPMHAPVPQSDYLAVEVEALRVNYALPTPEAKLAVTAAPEVLTPLYHGRRATFRATVRNDGGEYYSYIGIMLQASTGANPVRQHVGNILTRIPAGETRTLTYVAENIDVPAGAYDIVLVHDPENALSTKFDAVGPEPFLVTKATVSPEPAAPNFRLSRAITIEAADGSAEITPNEPFTVTCGLSNSGGYGDGLFALIFFNRAEEQVSQSAIYPLSLGRLKVGELKVTHRLNQPAGEYAVILCRVEGNMAEGVEPADKNGMPFAISIPAAIAPIPETSPAQHPVRWFDLDGRPASSAATGLRISTGGTKRFAQ